jgi:hypothetical protein
MNPAFTGMPGLSESILSCFPYFENTEVGLLDLLALYVSVYLYVCVFVYLYQFLNA